MALFLLFKEFLLEGEEIKGRYKQFFVVIEIFLAEGWGIQFHGGRMADAVLDSEEYSFCLLFQIV